MGYSDSVQEGTTQVPDMTTVNNLTEPNAATPTQSEAEYFYRLRFKLKIYESRGYAFQELFNAIMERSNIGYQSIQPYPGDGGNDGYIEQQGKYFQVYGPNISNADKVVQYAQKKLREDFGKLKNTWDLTCPIQSYCFVINDYYRGIQAPLEQTIKGLEKDYSLQEACVWGAFKLEEIFKTLSDSDKDQIVGYFPLSSSISPSLCDSRKVAEILYYLANKRTQWKGKLSLPIAPEFNKKLKFNHLNPCLQSRLQANSYATGDLDDYFEQQPSDSQAIGAELTALYTQSKKEIPDSDEEAANIRYLWLCDKMLPRDIVRTKKDDGMIMNAYEKAAEIVLSKYFESCDVYEKP